METDSKLATDSHNNVYGRLVKEVDPRSRHVGFPVYNGRKEFRASDRRPWDPHALLVVRVDAIEHGVCACVRVCERASERARLRGRELEVLAR